MTVSVINVVRSKKGKHNSNLVSVIPNRNTDTFLNSNASRNNGLIIRLLLFEERIGSGERHTDVKLSKRNFKHQEK